MNGRLAPHSLILVMMMLTGAAPHSCPASCKICSVKLTNCDSVSSLHEVLPGLSNATEAIILLNGGLSVIPPASFQNFSTLRWLYINGCRVTALANRTFLTGPGNSLQELDLNNNRLESCSVDILAFAGLARLEKLILTNNALDALKMSWFTDLILLTKLNVSANMITYIAPRTFESLVMLSHLDLADNRIQYLHTGTFNGLDSLTELNISRNRIVSIDDHAFDPLKALRILWLVGNRLIALPNLPELVENVYLRENPWECSCKLVNLIRVLVEKVADNAKVLCDRPAQLKGQKAMDVGPDICSNASAPGGNTPQGRPQSLNLLYSFIGGLFCAVIICLAVCFFVKRSKQGRATNPEDQREDVVDSSHKSATGGIPIKMAAAKELTRHHLRPASKQAPPNNQRIDSFENCPSELSGSTYSGRKKNTGIVSPMHSPSMDPVARSPKKTIDGAEKPVSEANQEIKGSNQRGSQFLGSAGNSMSENSAKTEGLSKSFTAPDLLFTNQEQNLFNFSGLRTSFGDHRGSSPAISKHPLSYATEGLQPTPDKPNLHGMQSIQYINDGHNLHSRQGIPHIPDDLNVYSTQCLQPTHDDANYNSTQVLQPSCNDQKSFSEEGPQTTPDDPNLCSMQGLQNIPEEPQRFSKGAVQPTNDKLKICIPKSLPTIPDHSKLDSLEALQATPDKEKTHMTQNVQSSAADQESCSTQSTPGPSKYYSAQRLHPAQKDSKSCPLPGLPAAAEDPKVFDATGLQLIPRDPKYTRTEGVLPVTEDAECIRTPDCLPAAEELQCSFRFASAEDLGCLPSSDAAHNPAKRARDAPDGPFHKGTSKETDEIQIMAPVNIPDQHILPSLNSKPVKGHETCAEQDMKTANSRNFLTLPVMPMNLGVAQLYAESNLSLPSKIRPCGSPCLITVEPAPPGSCPQEQLGSKIPSEGDVRAAYRAADKVDEEPTATTKSMHLEPPRNHESLLIEGAVEHQLMNSHGTLVQNPSLKESMTLRRSSKAISPPSASLDSRMGNTMEAVGKNMPITNLTTSGIPLISHGHLQPSQVTSSDTQPREHPCLFHSLSGEALTHETVHKCSTAYGKDGEVNSTQSPLSNEGFSDEEVLNPCRKGTNESTRWCKNHTSKFIPGVNGKAIYKNDQEKFPTSQVKETDLWEPSTLVEGIHPTKSRATNQSEKVIEAGSKTNRYTGKSTPKSSCKSAMKYACSHVGFTHNQFLANLRDKYTNLPDDVKERHCSDDTLWKALAIDGILYKNEFPKSRNIRKKPMAEGNERFVLEQCQHGESFTHRLGSGLRAPTENIGGTKQSKHADHFSRRSTQRDEKAGKAGHACDPHVPKRCLVSASRIETAGKVHDYFLERVVRKRYDSVFKATSGCPPCPKDNEEVLLEMPKEVPSFIGETIQVRECPSPKILGKEAECAKGEVIKESENQRTYLHSLYKTSPLRKKIHGLVSQESEWAMPDSNDLSVLANLHFCKMMSNTVLKVEEKEEHGN
ncbi:uncharacterized protein [Ambystoma mexicanum]|uniref:uncharacterized protein isoform X1 n=1 Tax=Ambystoma mexicanum TaxID=8296 RepID=UPI0037E7773C